MNFCPYPVEPWKLIMMTTYPLAAKSSEFQRYDQSSPHAPCGPPWMRNFTGYFLLASKFGGLTRKPSTLSPFTPGNQKDSSGDIVTWERTGAFAWVMAVTPVQISGTISPSTYVQATIRRGGGTIFDSATGSLRISLGC